VMDVAFVMDVAAMYFDNGSAHPPGFRIPAYVVAHLESLGHGSVPVPIGVPIPGAAEKAPL
jgi:hypothetical protein